ncbi:MAG: T9SS type A sorting domain-containing protein, partial [Chitinophagales bacterium]|nr:T9SS type A sorting domain-containing protein [Chitinophagales bacterium]
TVLNAALVRDQPMTTGDAKAVILNNSPVTDTIYSVLEEEKPAVANNVVVINAQEGSSARNDLESEIGSINLQRYLEIRDLRNYYEDNDSVENMYDYAKEKEMNLLSTPYAMATNDWDGAQELINQLLSATEEDYNLKTYFQFALDKNAAGESVYELSADESATVSAAKNEETYSGILAANLDAFVNDDWYFEELPVIDETQMRTAAVKDYSEIEIPQLYPNPATYEVFIVIPSGTEEENIFIVVSDLFGKELKHIPVISKSTEVSINVSDLSAGIYHCVIQSSNQIFRNSKLVFLH